MGLAASSLHRASTVFSPRCRPVGGAVEVRRVAAFRFHSGRLWPDCNSINDKCLPPNESVWKTLLAIDFRMFPVVERGPAYGRVLQQLRAPSAADTMAKRRAFLCVHGAGIYGVVP